MRETIPGTRDIARRIVNAENGFIENVMEQFGTTEAEAVKVLIVFRKAKAVKLDVSMGRYDLTHGAFWEAPVIRRAINA